MKILGYINDVPIEDYSEEELLEMWIIMISRAAEAIGMKLVFK